MTRRSEEIRTKLEAGRTGIAGRLRSLADEIEGLPLDGAAQVLSRVGGDQVEGLLREADRILGAQDAAYEPVRPSPKNA